MVVAGSGVSTGAKKRIGHVLVSYGGN